jgi:C4-dicarboxylate-specific signal transduction histidine kinase
MNHTLSRIGRLSLALGLSALWAAISLAEDTSPKPERAIDIRVVLSALSALADRRIESMADALTVAARGQDVQSLEWDRMKPLLAVAEERFGPANVWFARPDGSYFTVEKGLTGMNLKDRPYFPKVMAGQTSVGELVVSRATGGNTVIVAVPVMQEGKAVGALGASIYLDRLAQQLKKAAPLPEGVVFYALDGKGQIALHTQEGRIFQEAAQLGGPTLTEAVRRMLATPEGVVSYDFEGARQKAIYHTSALTGWKFAVRFPAE